MLDEASLSAIIASIESGSVRPGDRIQIVRLLNPSADRATARALKKMRAQSRRDTDRRDLEKLRVALRAAKQRRSRALATIRARCKAARTALRAEQKHDRLALGNRCQWRAYQARTAGGRTVTRASSAIAEQQKLQRRIRDWERKTPSVRSTDRERRQESDQSVEGNLPPDLIPVWRKVRRTIRGGPYRSRTEAFLEWAEENPGEVWAIREADAAKELTRLLRAEQRASSGVPF